MSEVGINDPGDLARAPSQDVSALRRYLAVARRRRLLIAACLIGPVLLAIFFSFSREKQFQGTAEVVIDRQSLADSITGTTDPASFANDFIRIVQTQATIARSRDVAELVVEAVPEADMTPEEFLANSSVEPALDADVLNFHAVSTSKSLAEELSTEYANAYVDYRQELDTAAVKSARLSLQRRIELLDEQGGKSELLSQLQAKEEQLRIREALETANSTVVNSGEAEQIVPAPATYLMVALLGGFLLAIAAAWAREALDTRIRSVSEIEERLGAPLLAHIPPPPRDLSSGAGLVALEAPGGSDAEAMRVLRTNISFAILDRDIRTIMVTSAVEQEGKSTTIANLAVTLARAGSRVVVVDLDLRRPRIDKLFGMGPGPGMTDVVLHRATLEQALVNIPVSSADKLPAEPSNGMNPSRSNGKPRGGLRVLRSGVIPPDPGEFVTLPSLREILGELRDDADYVLVDAPPVLPVGDAMSLSPAVDGAFLVVRLPRVRRGELDGLHRAIAGCQAPILGFVVAGKNSSIDSYGYYGPYQYQYASDTGPAVDLAAEAVAEPVAGPQNPSD